MFLTQNERGERIFQREAFRKSVASKSIRRFLGVFMESQMFAGFIQDRELRKCRAKGRVYLPYRIRDHHYSPPCSRTIYNDPDQFQMKDTLFEGVHLLCSPIVVHDYIPELICSNLSWHWPLVEKGCRQVFSAVSHRGLDFTMKYISCCFNSFVVFVSGLFEQRVELYLEELPDTEQSGVNKFLKGLGELQYSMCWNDTVCR